MSHDTDMTYFGPLMHVMQFGSTQIYTNQDIHKSVATTYS